MTDTISSERIRALSILAAASAAITEYDRLAATLGEKPLSPFLDLDATPAPSVVVPANVDGIVPGSLADDGSVLLEGWQRLVRESANGDKWEQRWAAQSNRTDRFMIADTLALPNLTERQRFSIAKNLEHAGTRFGLWGYDVNDTAVQRRGASEFAWEMTPNESGLGQNAVAPIPGVGSFTTQAKASEAYQYAISARRKWIQGQPAWVSETTGVVYGKPKS